MRPVSQDVAEYLAANSHGVIGTDLFIAVEPDAPDNVITIYDTGGMADAQSGAAFIEEPTIQVRARNKDYRDGWEKITDIVRALTGDTKVEVNGAGANYVGFWIQSGPMVVGRDDNQRHRLTANLRCLREES